MNRVFLHDTPLKNIQFFEIKILVTWEAASILSTMRQASGHLGYELNFRNRILSNFSVLLYPKSNFLHVQFFFYFAPFLNFFGHARANSHNTK
jgi:hypothetical protein